jgi:hypothetical protein
LTKDNVEEWLQSDVCELGFQHMTDSDIVNANCETKGTRRDGDESEEEGQSSKCISRSMALQCADTLLDYMG